MSRNQSELISAFGTAFEAFKALVEDVFDAGGDDGDLRRMLTEHDLRRRMAEAMLDKHVRVHTNEVAPAFDVASEIVALLVQDVVAVGGGDLDLRHLMINHAQQRRMAKLLVGDRSEVLPEKYAFTPRADIASAIKAGRYDWHDEDINADVFERPASLPPSIEAVLVKMNHDSVEGLLAELRRLGFRPGTLHELLAFGASYPDHYRTMRIFALGTSKLGGKHHVESYPVIEDHFSWSNSYKRRLDLASPVSTHDYQQTRFLAVPL